MAVAFDAVGPSSSGTTSATSPLTWTHVCGASATHLLVGATWDGNPDGGGSMSATYNGVSMTSLGVWHTGGAAAGFLQVWALASPATGSHSVSVTAGGSPLGLNGGSVSFTGSGGLSAVQTAVSSGNVANASLTFTGSISGNVVAAFVGGGSPQTPTGSFTSRYNESAGSGQQGAGYTACSTIDSPGGSTTASWTMNADLSAVAAVEVQAGTGPVQAPQQQRGGKRYRSHFGHRQTPIPALVAPPVVTVNAGVATASAVAPPAYAPRAVIAGLGGTGAGFFADQGGSPRFLLADNPWALVPNAGRWAGTYQTDIDGYCDNRGGQGYTAVYIAPLGNTENGGAFADGRTHDGVFPFTVNGTAASTASLSGSETIGLNSSYWTRVDYFLTACARNGMTGMLNVGYEGPGDFAAGGALSTMTATQFGQYGSALAARYAATANIIWVVGNDYFGGTGGTIGSGGGTPAGDDAKFSSLLSGLRGGGDAHVITIHNFAESDSRQDIGLGTVGTVQQWGNNNAQFSGVYSYNVTYLGIEDAYGEPSPIPVMLLDGYFYQGTSTYSTSPAYDRAFRQDTWHAVSSGARGVSQGSESIWQWPSTALAASGADWFHVHNAGNIRTLVESLPNWHLLIPDTSSVLVTAGRGSRHARLTSGGGSQYEVAFTDTFVTASRTAAGDLALIYLSHATTITIDQTKMVSGYVAYWADPITGAKTSTGTGTTYNSATPGNNSQGDPDWVLVLQAATPGAAPAGVASASATAAAPGVAVSAFAGVATATGTALAPAHAATASAGVPASAASAPGPLAAAAVPAGVAAALAVAPAATVSTSAGTSAPAGVAAATAVALAPSVAITASGTAAAASATAPQPLISAAAASGPATAAGTSLAATAATAARPGPATGSAAAQPAVPALTVPAGAAASLAIAPPATVSTSGNTNVPAGVASATGAALSPAVAATVPAGIAPATAAAPAATGQAARLVSAGVAAAAGTAPGPALTLAAFAHAGAAAALAQALPASAVSVLPFTVGTLTAAAAPAATLTAASAPGGTAGGTITSGTQRTGGPS